MFEIRSARSDSLGISFGAPREVSITLSNIRFLVSVIYKQRMNIIIDVRVLNASDTYLFVILSINCE